MRIAFRLAAITLTVGIAALTSGYADAGGPIRCVLGKLGPDDLPPPDSCLAAAGKIYDNLNDAEFDSPPTGEIRVYGTVRIDQTVNHFAKTIAGGGLVPPPLGSPPPAVMSNAKLDARHNHSGPAIRIFGTATLNNIT